MRTTISVIAYKSKILSNGEHPIMLRLAKDGRRVFKSLGLSCHPKKWDFKKQRPKKNHHQYEMLLAVTNAEIHKTQEKVMTYKASGKDYTLHDLIRTDRQHVHADVPLFTYYNTIIKRLVESSKIGNANVYKDSLRSLESFVIKKHLRFDDITYSFLSRYESYLRIRKVSESTCSVYFRTLRSVYNKAIKEKIADASKYPFKDFHIASFKVKPNRRAITKGDIESLTHLDLNDAPDLYEARQYFLFSYYGQGINFTDIARLKWSDIHGDRIFYSRKKTGKAMHFKPLPEAQSILSYWSLFTQSRDDNYIFKILDRDLHKTEHQVYNRIKKIRKRVNKNLKTIGRMANIDTPLTTYVARHTFATVLKYSGVSTAIISEAMGHSSESVTQHYLKSFGEDVIDEAMENLI